MKQNRKIILLSLIAAEYFLLFSCRSVSTLPEYPLSEIFPPDSGASVYVLADAKNISPILEYIDIDSMNNKHFRQMLDQTQSVTAAVYIGTQMQNRQRFLLCALGKYPALKSNIALGLSRDWKKIRFKDSSSAYWYSEKNRLSVVIDAKQAFVSPGEPVYPVFSISGIQAPEGFDNFRKGAVISCWFSDPATVINKKLEELEIPIELPAKNLFFGLFVKSDNTENSQQYEALIQMQVENESLAKGLVTAMIIARAFMPVNYSDVWTQVLFANPPVQDGDKIAIKSAVLNPHEISLLFSEFLLF